jgi:hypothetical protein
MQRLTGAGLGLARTVSIWEPVRFGAPAMAATLVARACVGRPGFERAAEDPLRARE